MEKSSLTPMMQQYMEIKDAYRDCILFYRLGDFYEMFFDDALTCTKELEITLTGKNCGLEERAPMCGVPFHSAEGYISRLIAKGYKVAICEQVEDPGSAKGLVRREVIRIVTPGTNLNEGALDEGKNNFLMGIVHTTNAYGVAAVDVTTGDFFVTQVGDGGKLLDEVNKYLPSEILCNDSFFVSGVDIADLKDRLGMSVSAGEPRYFDEENCEQSLKEHFRVASLAGLGLKDFTIGIVAAGAVLQYLRETQKIALRHMNTITPYTVNQYMLLDRSTRRNLELVETLREKQKKGSLLWVLDKTKTAMGARLLRVAIEQPLLEADEINRRLDAVQELGENMITREEVREYLQPIYDIERLVTKISYKNANPRDLIAFGSSLAMLPHVKYALQSFSSPLLREYYDKLDVLEDVCGLVERSIDEAPPLAVKEGGIIKTGYNEEVDRLRASKTEGKNWLAELEAKEKEKTGIKNLRVKFNKVFGYYLEVTNSYKDLVPEEWIRKQTLANAERYTTNELKELEDVILGAEDKLYNLEYELFCEIRDKIFKEVKRVQTTAKVVAGVDLLASLSLVAEQNGYVRPDVNVDGVIDIKDGRHPVVEKMIRNDLFIANDTYLDNGGKRISIITGPNMAGKSTYMRQTALIVLMAQIGSFVPAKKANVGIVDRIFTRVGASDDLASGQSTFMVEMTEMANILRNATRNSLVILDEIGRGTSTFDGLAIAWAVVEYIANVKSLGAKTLFATHYHELTDLEGGIEGVNNYCIAVKEQGEDIVFLRKIVKGGADKSYGIQVAKLAGVPDVVLKRAHTIVEELSDNEIDVANRVNRGGGEDKKPVVVEDDMGEGNLWEDVGQKGGAMVQQMSMFEVMEGGGFTEELALELREMDLSRMTPIEALNQLYQIQEKVKNRLG